MNPISRRSLFPLAAGGVVGVLGLASGCSGQTTTVGSTGGGSGSGAAKTVSIAIVAGWDECTAVTYLWKNLLEGKGYTVNLQELDIASTFAGVASKQVDLYLDAWLPVTHATYWTRYSNQLESLNAWYSPADNLLVVPNYLTDVNTIADLTGRAAEFDNRIVGIEPGAGEMRLIKENVIPQYGLGDFKLQESSTAAMLAALRAAIKAKKAIVVPLWRPHWVFADMPIKALQDPKKAFGAPDHIEIIARQGFSQDQPEVAGWLKKLKATPDDMGSLMLLIRQKGAGQEEAAVKEWVGTNQALVDSWFA
jgi:glycine betaine/proline transport system substrate-binding protein